MADIETIAEVVATFPFSNPDRDTVKKWVDGEITYNQLLKEFSCGPDEGIFLLLQNFRNYFFKLIWTE